MHLTGILLEEPEPLPYAFAELKDVATARAFVLAWTQHGLLICQQANEQLSAEQLRETLMRIKSPSSIDGLDIIMNQTPKCRSAYENGEIDIFARAWATAQSMKHQLQ